MIYTISYYTDDIEKFYANIYDPKENPSFEDNEIILYTKKLTDKTIIVENLIVKNFKICQYDKSIEFFLSANDSEYEVKYINCVLI